MPSIDFNDTNVQNIELDANGDLVFRTENGDEYTWAGPRDFFGGDDYHYAGSFDGATADARLDNALAAAVQGDCIMLENATYAADRTISTRCRLVGAEQVFGVEIEGNWTLNEFITLENVRNQGGTITVDNVVCALSNIYVPTIVVNADDALITNCIVGDVTFNSGTSRGLVDSSIGTTVTDSGSNSIGDIA